MANRANCQIHGLQHQTTIFRRQSSASSDRVALKPPSIGPRAAASSACWSKIVSHSGWQAATPCPAPRPLKPHSTGPRAVASSASWSKMLVLHVNRRLLVMADARPTPCRALRPLEASQHGTSGSCPSCSLIEDCLFCMSIEDCWSWGMRARDTL
jgi:hypothetical protein